ncbi:MAG: sporulation initiation factor Spo0A C-terminal domain-containing protein [Ruminococcus sp.]|nr:sporulation initiation factor Spo0A C-terminal domain-containing protein [Ruminococcus sp.]
MRCRILIGDRFDGIGKMLADKLFTLGFDAVCCSNSPEAVLEILENEKYDGLVYNMMTKSREVYDMLDRVSELCPQMKVYLLSYVRMSSSAVKASGLKASVFILMPSTVSSISSVIMLNRPYVCGELIMPEIAAFLAKKGFSHTVSGFDYLCIAVEECVKEPELLSEMTTRLYPIIAERCCTTARLAERMLRHLGELAAKDGVEFRNYRGKFPISNREMIAAVTDEFAGKYGLYSENEDEND